MNTMHIDPKADPTMVPTLKAALKRGELRSAELRRRGLKFLPSQVLRALFAKEGLAFGPAIKSHSEDFLIIDISQ